MKAQKRFSRMLRSVARLSRTASGMSDGRLFISTTSAASTATSVPAPMAMPMSAVASAGASLMPSPTIATAPNRSRSDSTAAFFPSGNTPAITSSTPTSRPTASAVR